ncbi:hypothetical protein U9M48_011298 [Paspalum notatum var. saurae]|uniref:Glycosyltransferase subfamily 4-like N-terminal domain-containing protein n=1 Tax=Paspalum notatum var. saurae TaxID=547442 RepID=A0AAQ3WHF4_PASNO
MPIGFSCPSPRLLSPSCPAHLSTLVLDSWSRIRSGGGLLALGRGLGSGRLGVRGVDADRGLDLDPNAAEEEGRRKPSSRDAHAPSVRARRREEEEACHLGPHVGGRRGKRKRASFRYLCHRGLPAHNRFQNFIKYLQAMGDEVIVVTTHEGVPQEFHGAKLIGSWSAVLLTLYFSCRFQSSFPCPWYQKVPFSLALSPRIIEVARFKPDIIHASSPGIMVGIRCPYHCKVALRPSSDVIPHPCSNVNSSAAPICCSSLTYIYDFPYLYAFIVASPI